MQGNSHISTGAIPKSSCANFQKEVDYVNTLKLRYLKAIEEDIKNNEIEQNKLIGEINKLNNVMEQLKILSEQPEWPDSFIQINPLAYVSATIIHTGEHYVKLGSDMYSLMSLNETLRFLQKKNDHNNKILDQFKEQQKQLEERSNFISLPSENNIEVMETKEMPTKIVSNKGVALKTAGGFYEVMENYDEDEEKEFYKKRQQNRTKIGKEKKNMTEEIDNLFVRLEELEKQEELQGELESHINNKNISERVKMILKSSGLYSKLLDDNVIQDYCNKCKTTFESNNENILNELIVESLINVPNYTDFSDSDTNVTICKNDIAVSDFLDNIENNLKQWNL